MGFNSAFNWLRKIRSVIFVVPLNEQVFDSMRAYANAGVCCAAVGNHEQ
jgi:hypothetical protein